MPASAAVHSRAGPVGDADERFAHPRQLDAMLRDLGGVMTAVASRLADAALRRGELEAAVHVDPPRGRTGIGPTQRPTTGGTSRPGGPLVGSPVARLGIATPRG